MPLPVLALTFFVNEKPLAVTWSWRRSRVPTVLELSLDGGRFELYVLTGLHGRFASLAVVSFWGVYTSKIAPMLGTHKRAGPPKEPGPGVRAQDEIILQPISGLAERRAVRLVAAAVGISGHIEPELAAAVRIAAARPAADVLRTARSRCSAGGTRRPSWRSLCSR